MTQTKKVQFDKLAEEASATGQENMQAWVSAGNVFLKGAQDYMQACVSVAQQSSEYNAKAMKTLMGCKTVTDFTDAQSNIAKQGFENFVATSTQLTELSVKLCTEAFQPINDQVSKTVKKASEAMAA
jgi:phasin family protein